MDGERVVGDVPREFGVDRRFGHIAGDQHQPLGERAEHVLIDLSVRGRNAVVDVLPQRGDVPIAAGHADDRDVEYAAGGEPIQRWNDHLLGEIPGDAVQHQDLPSRYVHDAPTRLLDV
ncbi:hypothetical protein Misp02_32810 [Microtetraspora sp. NBRC 16547]|nr:hypothetical protein [Microtetraspora sp. NBRC 16547]GLW99194.1 hypothetical protein Misp02_32810 [Microtetraspora sp. NBRC 16547]